MGCRTIKSSEEKQNLAQSTEQPVIVEALDLTFRTIQTRIKRYRNLVISVIVVTAISVLLAILCHQWLFIAGLILLPPLVARFSVADSRSVRRWRAQILDMSSSRNLDLQFYVKTASELRKASPKILRDMLATIPSHPLDKNQRLTPDPFDTAQEKLEKKTIVSLALLTAGVVSAGGTVVFRSGGLLLLTICWIALLLLFRR
jgi:hypothetical protein